MRVSHNCTPYHRLLCVFLFGEKYIFYAKIMFVLCVLYVPFHASQTSSSSGSTDDDDDDVHCSPLAGRSPIGKRQTEHRLATVYFVQANIICTADSLRNVRTNVVATTTTVRGSVVWFRHNVPCTETGDGLYYFLVMVIMAIHKIVILPHIFALLSVSLRPESWNIYACAYLKQFVYLLLFMSFSLFFSVDFSRSGTISLPFYSMLLCMADSSQTKPPPPPPQCTRNFSENS